MYEGNDMSNFENLKKVKAIISDANKISTHNERFEEATKEVRSKSIDEYNKGFNAHECFKSFVVPVYFSTYIGASNFMGLESGQSVNNAFIKYLRDNEDAVLDGIARNLKEEANFIILKAKEEIDTALDCLSGTYKDL